MFDIPITNMGIIWMELVIQRRNLRPYTHEQLILIRDSMLLYEREYFVYIFGYEIILTSRESFLIMTLCFY